MPCGEHVAAEGVVGDVLPGELLGPIVGLTFSQDGRLLFACSGSSLWVYNVNSGKLLSCRRIFAPGVAVSGLDIADDRGSSIGAVFGHRCVRIVDRVPSAADIPQPAHPADTPFTPATTATDDDDSTAGSLPLKPCVVKDYGAIPPKDSGSVAPTLSPASVVSDVGANCRVARPASERSWFRFASCLLELDDRVWDARLIYRGVDERACNGRDRSLGEEREDGKREEKELGLVATALAHNSVEVWEWTSCGGPSRLFSSRCGDPCILYHARLWGRTLKELRVASGTVFNQVLVWKPGADWPGKHRMQAQEKEAIGSAKDSGGKSAGKTATEKSLLRLNGHEGVIFRVTWREDGKRVASVSDDRTVRVWDVDCSDDGFRSPINHGNVGDSGDCSPLVTNEEIEFAAGVVAATTRRLLWTGWGHVSRVWDVGFSCWGVVTAGEDGTAILWRECDQPVALQENCLDVSNTLATVTTASEQADKDINQQEQRLQEKQQQQQQQQQQQLKQRGNEEGFPTTGQLVPTAILRGHSRSHVWRLAVYEHSPGFDRLDNAAGKLSGERRERGDGGGTGGMEQEDGGGWGNHGVALMATGGNDGAVKLWDLAFEAASQKTARKGVLWGETDVIPSPSATDSCPCSTAAPPGTSSITTTAVSTGKTAAYSAIHDTTNAVIRATVNEKTVFHDVSSSGKAPLSFHSPDRDRLVATGPHDTATGNRVTADNCFAVPVSTPAGRTTSNGTPSGNKTEAAAPAQADVPPARPSDTDAPQGGSKSRGCTRGRGRRRRRQRPATVREVCLASDGEGAAVCMADGTVWWAGDVARGTWEPVLVTRNDDTKKDDHPTVISRPGGEPERLQESRDNRWGRESEGRRKQGIGKGVRLPGNRYAAHVSGVTPGGRLLSDRVSAIAVISLTERNVGTKDIGGGGSDGGSGDYGQAGSACAGDEHWVHQRSGLAREHRQCSSTGRVDAASNRDNNAIVIGRDDGCLFVLTKNLTMSSYKQHSVGSKGAPAYANFDGKETTRGSRSGNGSAGAGAVSGCGGDGNDDKGWRVRAAWKGHNAPIIAIWAARDESAASIVARKRCDDASPSHIAALDTSRLWTPTSVGRSGATEIVDGALISAAADGTLAWWDWEGDDEVGGFSYTRGASSSGVENLEGSAGRRVVVNLPRLRMRCRSGPDATISSFVIDDSGDTFSSSRPTDSTAAVATITAATSPRGDDNCTNTIRTATKRTLPPKTPAAAVVFCGDTKGNIRCFVGPRVAANEDDNEAEGIRKEGHEHEAAPASSAVISETWGGGVGGGETGIEVETARCMGGVVDGQVAREEEEEEGVVPCLVLRRQHGKDQITRLALLGEACLLSAGHDGHVNHYVISYRKDLCPTTSKAINRDGCVCAPSSIPPAELFRHTAHVKAGTLSVRPHATVSPVVLTLIACYPAAPVTSISDMWVGVSDGGSSTGSDFARENEGLAGMGGCGRIRVAVSGRSGSARMSVWDLIEGRQLLELECGDRHLAQDLVLSWPTSTNMSRISSARDSGPAVLNSAAYPTAAGDTAGCRSSHAARGPPSSVDGTDNTVTGAVSEGTGDDDQRYGVPTRIAATRHMISDTSICDGRSGGRSGGAVALLPHHTAVFASPTLAGTANGGRSTLGRLERGKSAEPRQEQQPTGGVMLSFHSSIVRRAIQQKTHTEVVARYHLRAKEQTEGRPQSSQTSPQNVAMDRACPVVHQNLAKSTYIAKEMDTRHTDQLPGRIGSSGITSSNANSHPNSNTQKDAYCNAYATGITDAGGNKYKNQIDSGEGEARASNVQHEGLYTENRKDGAGEFLPFHFVYSLGEPFHGQRVASVRFLPGLLMTADGERVQAGGRKQGGGGDLADMRLVTGGEDGVVKLLDVFYTSSPAYNTDGEDNNSRSPTVTLDNHAPMTNPKSSSNTSSRSNNNNNNNTYAGPPPPPTNSYFNLTPPRLSLPQRRGKRSWSLSYHSPYATVVQTLPPHESSIAALAIGTRQEISPHGDDGGECAGGCGGCGLTGRTMIFSGGGKMELRAWGLTREEAKEVRGMGTTDPGVPPVRWLLTTTPAPKSALHAHRIMSLCVLPRPPTGIPSNLAADSAHADLNHGFHCSGGGGGDDAVFVASGDSGGGVSIFVLRDDNGNNGCSCDRDRAAAERLGFSQPGHGDGGGKEQCRLPVLSYPAGRWMSKTSRPVLCLAHARVTIPPPTPGLSTPTLNLNSILEKHGATVVNDDIVSSSLVVDLVIAGDTGGVVTVWGVSYEHGGLFSADQGRNEGQGGMKGGGGVGSCTGGGEGEGKGSGGGYAEVRGRGFVHRGPEGRRRGVAAASVESAAARSSDLDGKEGRGRGGGGGQEQRPHIPRLVPVFQYRAHQMGVLCTAVQVSKCSNRVLIITGGDDQAICVAELETILLNEVSEVSADSDQWQEEGREGQDEVGGMGAFNVANRSVGVRLADGGHPEITREAAGSAIKGIALLPQCPHSQAPTPMPLPTPTPASTSTPTETTMAGRGESQTVSSGTAGVSTAVRKGDTPPPAGHSAYGRHRNPQPGCDPPAVVTVFTVSRDQRLSRWDIVDTASNEVDPTGNPIDTAGNAMGMARTAMDMAGHASGTTGDSVEMAGYSVDTDNLQKISTSLGASLTEDIRSSRSGGGGGGGGGMVIGNDSQYLRETDRRDRGEIRGEDRGSKFVEEDETTRQRRRRKRRWRLDWKAGCVTDVCDVSDIDVVALPATGPTQEQHLGLDHDDGMAVSCGPSSSTQPAADALVAVAGQGLQLLIFGGGERSGGFSDGVSSGGDT